MVDLVANLGGIFITLALDRRLNFLLQRRKLFPNRITRGRFFRNLSDMGETFVHVFQNRCQNRPKDRVAIWTAESAELPKIALFKTARRTLKLPRYLLPCKWRFHQQIRKRKTIRIGHPFALSTAFTKINLMDLVIDDLSEVHGRRFIAEVTLQRFCHYFYKDITFRRNPQVFSLFTSTSMPFQLTIVKIAARFPRPLTHFPCPPKGREFATRFHLLGVTYLTDFVKGMFPRAPRVRERRRENVPSQAQVFHRQRYARRSSPLAPPRPPFQSENILPQSKDHNV